MDVLGVINETDSTDADHYVRILARCRCRDTIKA